MCPLCLNDDYNMLLAAEARIAELTHEVAGLKIERDNAIGRARRAWDLVADYQMPDTEPRPYRFVDPLPYRYARVLPAQEQETPEADD
jgi:hypothetical protein